MVILSVLGILGLNICLGELRFLPITELVKRPIDLIVLLLESLLSLIMLFIQLVLKFLVSILLLVLGLRICISESRLGPTVLLLELIELFACKGASL